MTDQRLHRRIEAVALLELDAPGIRSRLRAQTPAGSKVWRIASTASTSASGAPSFSATVGEVAGEVAGLVDQVDQVLADHAAAPDRRSPARAARRDDRRASSPPRRRLRDCSRRRRARRRRRSPIRNRPGGRRRCAPDAAAAIVVREDVVEVGVELVLDGVAAGLQRPRRSSRPDGASPSGAGAVGRVRAFGSGRRASSPSPRAPAAGCARAPPRHRRRGRDSRAAAA